MNERTCSVDGCTEAHDAKGFCAVHYQRWRMHGDPLHKVKRYTPKGAGLEFIRKASQSDTDSCIVWPYSVPDSGYPQVMIGGKTIRANRLVLSLATGENPTGLMALHAPVVCHNTECVNPRHLRWGPASDNSADMLIDGTTSQGQKNANAILTADDVRAIRASRETHAVLAERFGVSKATISAVVTRRNWGWLS